MVWAIGNPSQDAALRELIRSESSDRVVAIVGGAILEDSLREAMISRLRSSGGHKVDINEKLFRVGGPLGFFMPKIDLGYQLYMFEKTVRNAMFGIAEIRNLFAHQLDMTFFSGDTKMVAAASKLKLHEGRSFYPVPWTEQDSDYAIEPAVTTREKFLVNLKLCLIWLMGDHTRHQLDCNIPTTWGPMVHMPKNNAPDRDESFRNILKLVEGSDEVEDAHALQILLRSIKTLAEKGLGRSN